MAPGGTPVEISYVDLVLIVLASVTVVVTALGVIIAVAAVWGMTGLRRAAHEVADQHCLLVRPPRLKEPSPALRRGDSLGR